jgi:E3 ubiquitin-protein ligase SHPRH
MRREFFKARLLAGAQRAVLYALDELGMAVTRVRLRLPGETFESEVEKNITVRRFEIPALNARFTTEKFAAQSDLQKCKGTLRYLKVG